MCTTHTHKHTTLGDKLGSNGAKSLLEMVQRHVGELEFTDSPYSNVDLCYLLHERG